MPRLPYSDLSKHPESIRKALILNIQRMMANASVEVYAGFHKLATAFYEGSPLLPDHREIAVLRAGHIAGSSYEVAQHEHVVRKMGMSEAQIAAIRAGGQHPGILDEAQQSVLDFTDEFIVEVRPSDDCLARVRQHLSDEQLFDLMFVTGLYMTISRIIETSGVPLDEALMEIRPSSDNS